MKTAETQKRIACVGLFLAVCAYIAYFIVCSLSGSSPTILLIPPLLAVFAVYLGHLARRSVGGHPPSSYLPVSLAALILGYIFLGCSLILLSGAMWFSHTMKDFH
jgi:hypothetical protein